MEAAIDELDDDAYRASFTDTEISLEAISSTLRVVCNWLFLIAVILGLILWRVW